MRLKSFINERTSIYGSGITFMDIDETILHTTARVIVRKNGKEIKRLRNHEFLVYKPAPDESFDFSEYTDAALFHKTATPVQASVDRIKRMFKHIAGRGSRIVIISARANSNDKNEFLQTFRDLGIPIDDIYIERVGESGAAALGVPEKKKAVMFKYLNSGLYRRARLIDDSTANCKAFLELEDEIPQETINKMRKKYNIPEGEPVIDFYALKVTDNGSLLRITRG